MLLFPTLRSHCPGCVGKDALGPNASPEKNADSLAERRLNKVCLGRAHALGCAMSCRGVVVTELQARTPAAKRNGSPGPACGLLSSGTIEVLAKSQAFSLPRPCADAPLFAPEPPAAEDSGSGPSPSVLHHRVPVLLNRWGPSCWLLWRQGFVRWPLLILGGGEDFKQ